MASRRGAGVQRTLLLLEEMRPHSLTEYVCFFELVKVKNFKQYKRFIYAEYFLNKLISVSFYKNIFLIFSKEAKSKGKPEIQGGHQNTKKFPVAELTCKYFVTLLRVEDFFYF